MLLRIRPKLITEGDEVFVIFTCHKLLLNWQAVSNCELNEFHLCCQLSFCFSDKKYYSLIYFFKYFKKLHTINIITKPIGKAATILTDWRLLIELSANTNAIGRRMSRMHHMSWMDLCGSSPSLRVR